MSKSIKRKKRKKERKRGRAYTKDSLEIFYEEVLEDPDGKKVGSRISAALKLLLKEKDDY